MATGIIDFDQMFVQSEMTNMSTDEQSNTWKWKKNQVLFQFTRNKYYAIVKIGRYPSSTIYAKEITEKEADKLL